MKISLPDVLNIFKPGAKPAAQDWINAFSSFVHMDNQAAVDGQVVDQKIANYDSSLRSRQSKGAILSLGDILSFLVGISDTAVLKTILSALTTAATWAQLPGKPATINLSWSEQVIDTSGVVSPPLNQQGQSWLCSPNSGLLNKHWLIVDMQITRTAFSPSNGVVVSCDEITAVKIAVTPYTNLS